MNKQQEQKVKKKEVAKNKQLFYFLWAGLYLTARNHMSQELDFSEKKLTIFKLYFHLRLTQYVRDLLELSEVLLGRPLVDYDVVHIYMA